MLDPKYVLENPDFIIVNAGGMSLRPRTIKELRRRNIITIGISLSDPDVFPQHGRIYSKYYDLYYTNSQYSLKNQYRETRIKLLPFAASTKLHRPLNSKKISPSFI